MICSRCIFDSSVPGISFDGENICNYCREVDRLAAELGTRQKKGSAALQKIINEIKSDGRGKRYDCVIGISGGTDSSYLLLKAVEWGLRPLAVHYDNTWNTAVATENIRKVTTALRIDLHTYVVNNKEIDSIKLAYLRAGVQEFDTDTDLAFVQVLRQAAAKNGIKYILEGHSFIAEGISPANNNYFDGGYIASIVKRFGGIKIKTYPLMTFWQFMKWVLIYRQKFIRPFWYISHSKEEARRVLSARTGWTYYGGHHLENRASCFAHTVWIPQRFNTDYRNLSLAASVRAGLLSREDALRVYQTPITPDPELIAYVKKRLSLSDEAYERLMAGQKRTFREFKTYKRRFELLRPLFFVLAKANLVPKTFYTKYCFPLPAPVGAASIVTSDPVVLSQAD